MPGCLTHWGQVTHIYVSKLTVIGSDNGLGLGRRKAIFWTNVGILLIVPLGTNFREIAIKNSTFSFKIGKWFDIWKCRLENGRYLVSASMGYFSFGQHWATGAVVLKHIHSQNQWSLLINVRREYCISFQSLLNSFICCFFFLFFLFFFQIMQLMGKSHCKTSKTKFKHFSE